MFGVLQHARTRSTGRLRDLAGKVYNYQSLTKALPLSSSIKIRERILNSKDEELGTVQRMG